MYDEWGYPTYQQFQAMAQEPGEEVLEFTIALERIREEQRNFVQLERDVRLDFVSSHHAEHMKWMRLTRRAMAVMKRSAEAAAAWRVAKAARVAATTAAVVAALAAALLALPAEALRAAPPAAGPRRKRRGGARARQTPYPSAAQPKKKPVQV